MSPEARDKPLRIGEHLEIARFFYRHEAELARSVLEANGVESFVVADDTGGQGPGLQYVRGVALMVHVGEAPLARQILDDLESGEQSLE